MMKTRISLSLFALLACCSLASSQQQQQHQKQVSTEQPQPGNFPYYMQSPIATVIPPQNDQQQQQHQPVYVQPQQQQKPLALQRGSIGRSMSAAPAAGVEIGQTSQQQQQPMPNLTSPQQQSCLYDKRYFARFDECLAKRPYATIGLAAFKNDDLLVKQSSTTTTRGNSNKRVGSDEKRGCSFVLSNGLFKNYLISSYSIDSNELRDSSCLESNGGKVSMSLEFSNVTLYYLWQLRCLNYADQLLDNSIANEKVLQSLEIDLIKQQQQQQANETLIKSQPTSVHLCAGSSQTFGFASMQLNNIETQIELIADVYKNWRITNVTVNYAQQTQNDNNQQQSSVVSSIIKDYTFESLDGDELNWRYLQMYSNWTRNRLHTNFLEQFKRFIWISLQRCLSEHSDKLPVKLNDIFGNHKYN